MLLGLQHSREPKKNFLGSRKTAKRDSFILHVGEQAAMLLDFLPERSTSVGWWYIRTCQWHRTNTTETCV